jgi:hypothetical protein
MKKIDVIEKSRGRFFGLKTKQGNVLNARYVSSSDKYLTVFDRNEQEEIKLAKKSVKSVSYGGETFR